MDFDVLAEAVGLEEGWRQYPYHDSLGYQTIGYGFLIDDRRGAGLPREVGEYWLRFSLRDHWERLIAAKPWIAEQPEPVQQALGNMAYQLGVQGLLQFRMMLAALEAGDREDAAAEALKSRWAEQTPERARRIAAMIRGSDGI